MHLNYSLLFAAVQLLVGAQAKYPTTGVFTGIDTESGQRPARRDVTELRNDNVAFSLYIQGLQAMMDTPENNMTSYFQVSGIHGRPYVAWDAVGQASGAPTTGYCTHSDALFMSWHRPYLALYEQVLAQHVQIIAKRYNSATYQAAADKFRIPYWDWAAPPYRMPDFFSSSTIQITTPSGQRTVNNPLATYKFQGRPYPDSTFPRRDFMQQYTQTVRRPGSSRTSRPADINTLLGQQAPGQAQQLYTVFTRSRDWNTMASQSSNGASFEGPHGWVHVTVGGDGHMSDVAYAGFDPIFWLHHTNVDRLGVMWQAIYPDSTMQPSTEGGGTYTIASGARIDAGTPLLPFHQKDGQTPWTTNTARYAKDMGYSYPDVQDWAMSTQDLKSSVTARVNQLYNVRGNRARKAKKTRQVQTDASKPSREWTISISAPNAALQGDSYSVSLFLTKKPSDATTWGTASIGSMFVLSQPMSGMANVQAKTEIVITQALQDRGIDTSDVNKTKRFLDRNLIWGVQKSDGTIIRNKRFKGLKVLVADDLVKIPDSITQLPVYSNSTVHPDVTPVDAAEGVDLSTVTSALPTATATDATPSSTATADATVAPVADATPDAAAGTTDGSV